MSRPLRIEYDHAFYHVTARGNEKKPIFQDKDDKMKFFYYLGLVNKRYRIKLYAYVLMDNHYHLLMETPQGNLSRVIRDLNGHYTIYFNRRHKRVGHLFQGRYKAILIDKDNYILALSRYIHLNPVRAKMVKRPEKYRDSSLAYYLEYKEIPIWLEVSWLLGQFSKKKKEARRLYREFVYQGIGSDKNPFGDLYAQSILGKSEFIQKIQDKFLKKRQIDSEFPKSRQIKYGKDLKNIAQAVISYYNIRRKDLLRRNKFNSAKRVFVYLSRRYTNNNLGVIRTYLAGTITASGISKIVNRVEGELKKNKRLRADIKNLGQRLFDLS